MGRDTLLAGDDLDTSSSGGNGDGLEDASSVAVTQSVIYIQAYLLVSKARVLVRVDVGQVGLVTPL